MGRDPAEPATPDLFSTNAVRDAIAPPTKPISGTAPVADPASARHILPKNLAHAIKQLSDGELDQLFKAAFDEAKRRGRLPRTVATDSTSSFRRPPDFPTKWSATDKSKRRSADAAEVTLTRGQVNAVRSAFKAGVTPSRIARQFGISQANVRKALASDELKR
jgi:hypothetical protein